MFNFFPISSAKFPKIISPTLKYLPSESISRPGLHGISRDITTVIYTSLTIHFRKMQNLRKCVNGIDLTLNIRWFINPKGSLLGHWLICPCFPVVPASFYSYFVHCGGQTWSKHKMDHLMCELRCHMKTNSYDHTMTNSYICVHVPMHDRAG